MFLPQRTARSFGLMFLAIIAVTGLSLFTLHQRESARARTARALNVLLALDDLSALVREAESTQRGYLLSDAPVYRMRYQSAARAMEPRLSELDELTAGDPPQHTRVVTLTRLADEELTLLARELKAREIDPDASKVDLVRASILEARHAEEAGLNSQLSTDGAFAARSAGAVLVGSALLLAFALIASLLVRGDFIARATAEEQLNLEQQRNRSLIDQLSKSNAALARFAHVASHDLKAPLRGMGLLARMLEEDLRGRLDAASAHNLMLLRGRAQRLEGLVDGILASSRSGSERASVEQVDAERVVADTVELLAPPPSARVEKKSPLPVLHTERVPFQQVWMNLVGNALKFNRRSDALIELSAKDAGRFWDFAVKDNGPGLSAEDIARIWSLHPTPSGSGIGLSVVKKIVEGKGGRAWVESAPGHGATFHFTWPKQEAAR
jgi:signal transduction histidine kinase